VSSHFFDASQKEHRLSTISFYYEQNQFLWMLMNTADPPDDVNDIIDNIKKLGVGNAAELHNMLLLPHYLGIEYRSIRLSLGW
jgi:hypothetical protein